MDGRGGCCIAKYTGGAGQYLSQADRIMLRFRPIAPKPTSDYGGGRKPVSSGESGAGSSDVSFSGGGGKRKYQQTENGGNARRCTRRRRLNKTVAHRGDAKVTLSLLPERPCQLAFTDMKVSVASAEKQKRQGPFWLSFSDDDGVFAPAYQAVEVTRRRQVVISSCMTVERVTDAWKNDGYGLGRSDEERKMNLVRDTCPGFVSDGSGRVTWTNEAYRKMARDNIRVEEGAPENQSGDDSFHVIVRLVMRERPMLMYTAFTCKVKLQFTCQDRERCSVTVPCDVWRMDAGGFAWRLDVKAALCL